ncbi:hypothetical protein AALB53_20940 [Lachnospiraceae bacterium 47-T17]
MNYSELLQLAKGWGKFISDRIIIWRLPYNYFNHLLTELPKLIDKDGNVTNAKALEALLPWAKELPDICRKPRR